MRGSVRFWPEDLALVFNFEPVEKADEGPVRDAALGFPVAWQTKFGHNARLVIVTDLKRGDDGWKSLSEQPTLRYRLEEPGATTSP
ncbi:MAG: hypothetical protein II007_00035 [Gammaproteobacteria bacterium]|nr:hypothetical protein [Gammaproteobacteria bacterium]